MQNTSSGQTVTCQVAPRLIVVSAALEKQDGHWHTAFDQKIEVQENQWTRSRHFAPIRTVLQKAKRGETTSVCTVTKSDASSAMSVIKPLPRALARRSIVCALPPRW